MANPVSFGAVEFDEGEDDDTATEEFDDLRLRGGDFGRRKTLAFRRFVSDVTMSQFYDCLSGVDSHTRGLQGDDKVGDADACAMGEGLKVNTSLEELELVSILCCFCFVLIRLCFDWFI